ncbi:CBS domain-containing protein [Streptomyces sp. RFCAC02]|uniref:CBS domain-containing protein n=1 Tax=Streptomyces sp. RFCAC02 TaxID=2499143 RepID=UPI00101EDDA9|nr:CBS domain-containing protein [Streptomyces sp. RFCAC02]
MAQTVADLMTREPATIGAEESVADAARLMKHRDTGDVAITDGGRLVGVVTDRDIAVRVVADDRGGDTPVRDAASTRDLVTVAPDSGLSDAARLMRERSVRRLPVVSDGELVGMLALGDLAIELDSDSGLAAIAAAEPNR